MTKKALGRGMDALFSTEQHKVEDISSNIEVKPQNLEVISSNSDGKTKTLKESHDNVQVKTENLKVVSSNSELQNIEDITYKAFMNP
jgi:hypothetical protein